MAGRIEFIYKKGKIMFTSHHNKIIRKHCSTQSYNICRSCKKSLVTPTTQGDYVTCIIDRNYPELGLNKNNDCKEYKRVFCWIFR